ncbi:Nuclear transcription factor Y subunit B [Parasponia andersonii]|uniref:Nuclear transcription factor Y subunit B n=1 Tax=Parasponia andersonii TaxID=3476 RepID=A0A2P5A8U3_PARAD|nr:Nuclear transcription factor Y subunit B [Parasponia andersonii]
MCTYYISAALGIVVANNNNSNNNTNDNNAGSDGENARERVRGACVVREQDQYMPIANVIRIMRRILPSHAKISDDAKETIQECVSEYISFITGEANDRCQREQRKTVTAEDVLWAMAKLGFDDYVEPLTLFLTRYRESETDRTSLRSDPFVKRSSTSDQYGHPGPYGPAFQLGPYPPGMFDATGGYFRDGSGPTGGGSSSQSGGLGSYDPFGHYK